MITIAEHTLLNGMKVLVNPDQDTGLAAVNLLYRVGARDERADQTGFAHLFEHLMFGGSAHIPDYDLPLQLASGENNAFTNNDYTNYYLTLPHQNLETAFWLESDRMLQLDFSERNLEVQKKVVIEEFHQRYLNQPYGDIWLLLRPLAYKTHPYQWAAIGKDIRHVEQASLTDVRNFFYRYYSPNNCILSVSGNVQAGQVFELAEKWFGDIPVRPLSRPAYPAEKDQQEERRLEVRRPVPDDLIYIAFHMGSRSDCDYHAGDLLSDILSSGPSARLTRRLVKEEQLLTEVNAFITGDLDPGLFIFTAKPRPGVSLETAEERLWSEIHRLIHEPIPASEVSKVKNKAEANHLYGLVNILNKAMSMSYFEMLGRAEDLNHEPERYLSVSSDDLKDFASRTFRREHASVLLYRSDQS